MRVVLQRVQYANVTIEKTMQGKIDQGFLALVGITHSDDETIAARMAKKCAELRVFEDEQGKMNRSLADIQGKILSVSQFTLYADCRHGRRPGFADAANPSQALPLYEYFNDQLRGYGIPVETGQFGADMKVELLNDGPVTIILDSAEW